MRNRILILAAGKGTRMGEGNEPKVLVKLKGKPLISYLLDELSRHKLTHSVIVVGFQAEKVKAALGKDQTYVLQENQKGTAHAVQVAQKQINAENVLVLYGDHPFIRGDSLKQIMRLHGDKEAAISMFTTKVPNFEGQFKPLEHFGRIIRNHQGKIIKITEYKDASPTEKEIKELNPGIYMFNTKWLWENIKLVKNKNAQKEYYLTDLIEIAIKQNMPIHSLEIPAKEVIGINSVEDLKLAETLI